MGNEQIRFGMSDYNGSKGFRIRNFNKLANEIRIDDIFNQLGGEKKMSEKTKNTMMSLFISIAGQDGVIDKNELKKYSDHADINLCIAGEYTKKLQNLKINDILGKILYNMYAKEIVKIEDENFLSVNAYSKLLKENNLKCLDREMNLNIGIRYSEIDNKTMIYIATPIIKIDY